MANADTGIGDGGRELIKVGQVLTENGGEVFEAESAGDAGSRDAETALGGESVNVEWGGWRDSQSQYILK